MQTMPTPSAALGTLTVFGCKVYFADRSTFTIKPPGNLFNKWRNAGAVDVQIVKLFFNETYQIWKGADLVTEPYCHMFHGARGDADFFWFDGATFGAGLVTEVPLGLPVGTIKTGSLLPTDTWRSIYNTAKDDMVL